MTSEKTGRLVILTGPSCAGKTPLFKALGRFYPELRGRFHKLVLVSSRAPRPGELDGTDFYFRSRAQVEALRADNRYAVIEARNDLQALDVQELASLLRQGDVLFEGNPSVGRALQTHPRLVGVNRLAIFLSPLSKEEIIYLRAAGGRVSLDEFLTDVMRRKLLRRTRRQKENLSAEDLKDVEIRASSAYRELQQAWHFQYVIPNHDGEDSDNWDAFYYLIGDARKTLEAFVAVLAGLVPPGVEKWEEDLLPSDSGRSADRMV